MQAEIAAKTHVGRTFSTKLLRWVERLPLTRLGTAPILAATLAIFTAAWVLRVIVDPLLPSGFPYVTFFPAVIVTSFFFGIRWGGFSALLCGIVAWYYFVAPVHSFQLDGARVALGFYIFVVATDLALVHGMQAANRQLIKERETSRELASSKELMVDELQRRVEERKKATGALLESEVKTRLATQTAGIGLWQWHVPTNQVGWDSTMFNLYGMRPTADGSVLYDDYLSRVHPDDVACQNDMLQDTVRRCGESQREFRIIRGDDGSVRHIRAVEIARAGADGKTEWIVGTNLDITDQKKRESHVQFLLAEVNHRAKNLLGVVMSIARQTQAADHSEFMQRFSTRVHSLAAGQDLLVEEEWKGVSLHDLVVKQLNHFQGLVDNRVTLSGDLIRVSPAALQTLGMALHELTTNASKYGALSNDTGSIAINWKRIQSAESHRFEMTWVESGGPPVSTPERKGFGSTVIGKMVEISLDGEVTAEFAEAGFSWTLACPFKTITSEDS